MTELKYIQNGDYLLPDLGLTEEEQKPLGKYGRMRLSYLENHRPILHNRLLLNGTLMEHLHEIDQTAQSRMELMMTSLMKQENVTEELKARDQMAWVGLMNNLQHQAEETILSELVYA